MLGVKMFSRKSGLVPGFTTLLKCTPECDGIAHRWKGIAGGNLFCVDLWRQMKCDPNSERNSAPSAFTDPRVSKAMDKHMGCRQQWIFGSLANSSLLSCRTCRDCCLRQVCGPLWHPRPCIFPPT